MVEGLAAEHAEVVVDPNGAVEVYDLSRGQLAIDGVAISRGRLQVGAVLRLATIELELKLEGTAQRPLHTPAFSEEELGSGDTMNSGRYAGAGRSGEAFRAGEVVAGRYRIISRLAQGGMGEVYQAEHIELQRVVAIKVMLEHLSQDPHFASRFKAEAVAASRIGHPNIVDVLDFGQTADGRFYFAMEYLEGQTLTELLAQRGTLPVTRVVALGTQVAEALQAAHAQGIHRDLKPDNVMLIERGGRVDVVKVLDFGVAKVSKSAGSTGGTAVGAIVGTPLYMAPEQALGLAVDARADLYSLGLMLHELLTGKQTFSAPTPMETVTKQINAPAPPLPGSVPAPLRALISRMLQKAPEQRPASAAEVIAALVQTPEPTTPVVPRWVMGTVGAVVLALAVVVVDLSVDSSGAKLASHEATPLVLPSPRPKPPPMTPAPERPVAPRPPEPPAPAPVDAQTVIVPENGKGTGDTPEQPGTLVVGLGHTVGLRIPGVTRIAVADPSKADIAPMPDGVKVTGKAEGYTNLLIWTKTGQTFKGVHVKEAGSRPSTLK